MAERFPFMRVYKEMADALSKEDRADFYDALINYALDGDEPDPSTGAAVFLAARRMVDKWKQTQSAGKARAEKTKTAGRSLDGRWTVAGSEKPAKEEKKKRRKDKYINTHIKEIKEKDVLLTKNMEKEAPTTKDMEKEQPPKAAGVRPQDVLDLYNAICRSLPKAVKLTASRERNIRARLKDNEPETFREVFEKVEASDFLSGRSGKWQMCNLDWIIEGPTHWQRILEGIYDNRERGNAVDSLRDRLNVNEEDRARAARLG